MQKIEMFLFLGMEDASMDLSYLLEKGMECWVLVNFVWKGWCEGVGMLAMT